jgi:hypothetical protein
VNANVRERMYCRDPFAYIEDFKLQVCCVIARSHTTRISLCSLRQLAHFNNLLRVFSLSPSDDSSHFRDLISFLSQIAHLYPRIMDGYGNQLLGLLQEQSNVLDAKLRLCLVKALILLRSKSMVTPEATLPLFFKMFGIHDKVLRCAA